MQRSLIIFARAPRIGQVKTRLAAVIGDQEALDIYRELGLETVSATAVPQCERVVAFTPADAEGEMRLWLGARLRYLTQGEGDLGARMQAAIADSLARGSARVVVIGTDCPTLTPGLIEEAFAALADADVVFGPASDGGYYLAGVKAAHPVLFSDVPWSSPDTLVITLRRATDAGLRVALLAEHADIDTHDDLVRWRAAGRRPDIGDSA